MWETGHAIVLIASGTALATLSMLFPMSGATKMESSM